MKKFFLAAFVATALSIGSQASASPTPFTKSPTAHDATPVVAITPESDAIAARSGPIRNLLRGLIELERRKNAWLRRTFS